MFLERKNRKTRSAIFLMLLGSLWCGVAGAATHAGQIMFSFGNVTITSAAGAERAAKRGEQIFSGDTVTTVAGRVQIKYTDGSIVSLTPNTVYQLDDYNFSGSADGTERGFFRLVKGGLRTVTGAIGRGDKANYRLTTPVATIGIRGTWFRALLDQFGRLLVSVGFDPDDPSGLIIANAVGQLELNRGENAVVENANTPPVRTDQQVVLDVPPHHPTPIMPIPESCAPENDPGCSGSPILPGAIVGGVGLSVVTNLVAAVTDNATLPPAGVGSDAFDNVTAVIGSPPIALLGDDVFGGPETGVFIIDLDAALASGDPTIQLFVDNADPLDIAFFQQKPAIVTDFHDFDPVLAWGRFTGGRILVIDDGGGPIVSEVDDLTGNQSAHFILGQAPGAIPTSGSAFYNLTGGTPSTSESGATIGPVPTFGFLSVNFGPMPSVFVELDVIHGGSSYFIIGDVALSGEFFSTQVAAPPFPNIDAFVTGPTSCFGSICAVAIDGFLAGPPAGSASAPSHAGFSYIIFEFDPIHGVAGFAQ